MTILGIETSCDETAAAVVVDGRQVLSNVVSSQIELHKPYGGVVPELAARSHLQLIDEVIAAALGQAQLPVTKLDAIAATHAPGLATALLIGLNAGKGMAMALGCPFVGINHVEAHLYSPLMDAPAEEVLPMVSLIVSGGHTILAYVPAIGEHRILGQTLDDAAGEAFDKVAKLLRLGYPGGPEVERLARQGNRQAYEFPRSMLGDGSHDFSFSGLKTSVLYFLKRKPAAPVADICASFQEAIVDVLVGKTMNAARELRVHSVSAAGGVSLNGRLRERLADECRRNGLRLCLAEPKYCTDNGAMIAALGYHKLRQGVASDWNLEIAPSIGLPMNGGK